MHQFSPVPPRMVLIVSLVITLYAGPTPAVAGEVDCLKCHAGLLKNKPVAHAAVQMGCESCHSGIADALKVPHKKTTAAAKGLSADQPDLCYGCHDKQKFTQSTAHPALGMGCTTCHDPHGGKKAKLLSAEVPDLCFTCHDKAEFSRKNVHPPVEAGMCLSCHDPHSSPQPGMLVKPYIQLCSECHDQIIKKPHAIAGFNAEGHPVGKEKKDRKGKVLPPANDPKRPGKLFTCASCHNPHSSDYSKLFRYPAKASMELCVNCHNY